MDYNDSIRAVKGVGEKAEQRFAKLQIREVGDLLEHYPRDYDEFHDTVPIRTLEEGKRMAIEGVLRRKPTVRNTSRIKIITALFEDETGTEPVTYGYEVSAARPGRTRKRETRAGAAEDVLKK